MIENGWLHERSYFKSFSMGWKLKKVLHSEQSKFQKIDVVETEAVGRLLLLDGKTMVSEKDEFVYHEVMAHLPYMVSRKCEKVLIIGGGDGGVVREFAKHKDIKQIDLVEIDERVVEVSKKYFPQCTSALDDPRVNVLAQDGFAFIKSKKNEYDIIVVDSTDPEDFASGLFSTDFYQDVHNALTEDGIMMNQTENPFLDEYGIKKIYQNMRKAFPFVQSFNAPMLIYPGVYWTFGFSSKSRKATDLNPSKRQEMAALERDLQWYNMEWHRCAFANGNFHKRMIGEL
ncbi:MAG: spermidine synthase [Halobacteriovoraceae bacterium]|nr:spermidine synthase [Halobacteriovoraceae bacterium]|tara:strand:- start:109502 stop:110359 length:858 start_codon:yes stop_codon:yes gene_type:complete